MRRFLFIFLSFTCIFAACKKKLPKAEILLEGTWRAGNLVIGDSVSPVDLSPVRLTFSKNSRYNYLNNIGQIQAGTYFLKDSLLITTDTTIKPIKETAVHIIKSTKDTLVLRMNLDSVETLMYLLKEI